MELELELEWVLAAPPIYFKCYLYFVYILQLIPL